MGPSFPGRRFDLQRPFMPRDRVPSIGFILSVVLAAAAGCGRTHPLSVPPGAELQDGATAGADVRTPLDGGALDVLDAPVALDASGSPDRPTLVDASALDAADALTETLDASTDEPRRARQWVVPVLGHVPIAI
jgi:hypothetical protein